ncbi:MAG: hypothetical protein B6I26_01100 [Desulfobacteraceae bacterium 4572_130]|nr:MAG: hypothetical protein B6I26_01100 [Desulfobacteraceae bacterium 4572_130]
MQINNLKNINSLKAQTLQKNLIDAKIKKDFNEILEKFILNKNQVANNTSNKLVSLGKINNKNSTVSQLIYSTKFKRDCWDIIYNDINSSKSFTKIKPNTEIFLNSETRELIWGDKVKEYSNSNNNIKFSKNEYSNFNNNTDFSKSTNIFNKMPRMVASEFNFSKTPSLKADSTKLAQAVRKFIGKDYSQMDCYELIVGGLKNIGVKYQGKGGLGKHLMKAALDRGFDYNHFFNGEGIVATSGINVFKKSILSIGNPDKEAKKIMLDMENLLKEGQILSFSTRTKGHTGIVSKNNNTWTFINSGEIDNNINGKNGHKGVGEENLAKEIQNWFNLAKNRKQGLKITLGAMDMSKLSSFSPKATLISRKT